jgi:thiamine-phosphate pyrophosphorylase
VSLDFPRVYPITDTHLSGLSHAQQVARLVEGGASLIQLRDKHAAPREFYRDAADALQIARSHNARLIINDRVDIALALRADGVHLGQTDLPVEAARGLLGQDAIIGFSTHNAEQAQLAISLPVDYIAFGPVFATSTKQNPEPVAGLEGLRKASGALASSVPPLPLVAIGGITLSNLSEAIEAGASSLAVIGALLADPMKIVENTKKMLALTSEAANNRPKR